MPFWSLESRARRVIETVAAYGGFTPVPIEWSVFVQRWVPGLEGDGLLVGINWSGQFAAGFDVEPGKVRESVEALLDIPTAEGGSA